MVSEEAVVEAIDGFTEELRVSMFLSGARTVKSMKNVRTWITGTTRQMIKRIEEIPYGD
jgi:isopentenyl diphosphate isomerase/L-lactate dehydrogenase-like FMN-dependent dehydrogenase